MFMHYKVLHYKNILIKMTLWFLKTLLQCAVFIQDSEGTWRHLSFRALSQQRWSPSGIGLGISNTHPPQ